MFTAEEVKAIAEKAAAEICARYPSTSRPVKLGSVIPVLDEQWKYEQYYDIENCKLRDGIYTRPSVKWKHEF